MDYCVVDCGRSACVLSCRSISLPVLDQETFRLIYVVGYRIPVSSFPPTGYLFHLSNEKTPGCLGCIGDGNPTQIYRDCNKPWNKDPYLLTSIQWKVRPGFLRGSLTFLKLSSDHMSWWRQLLGLQWFLFWLWLNVGHDLSNHGGKPTLVSAALNTDHYV